MNFEELTELSELLSENHDKSKLKECSIFELLHALCGASFELAECSSAKDTLHQFVGAVLFISGTYKIDLCVESIDKTIDTYKSQLALVDDKDKLYYLTTVLSHHVSELLVSYDLVGEEFQDKDKRIATIATIIALVRLLAEKKEVDLSSDYLKSLL